MKKLLNLFALFILITACSGPKFALVVQKAPEFSGLRTGSKLLLPAPISENLIIEQNCDSCHSLSTNAVAFDHDASLDSALRSLDSNLQVCDSICIEDMGMQELGSVWADLEPVQKWGPWFDALDASEWTIWPEVLHTRQRTALSYLAGASGADYLLLPIYDSVFVKANASRQGDFKVRWALSLWDLQQEKLLWAGRYRGQHSSKETGSIDRNWHRAPASVLISTFLDQD